MYGSRGGGGRPAVEPGWSPPSARCGVSVTTGGGGGGGGGPSLQLSGDGMADGSRPNSANRACGRWRQTRGLVYGRICRFASYTVYLHQAKSNTRPHQSNKKQGWKVGAPHAEMYRSHHRIKTARKHESPHTASRERYTA